MEVKHFLLMGVAIPVLFLGQASASEPKLWKHDINYIDPWVVNVTLSQDQCFQTIRDCMLEAQPIKAGQGRLYIVSQTCEATLVKELYQKPLDTQIKDHKIIGSKLCNGVISQSDMNLPFTKSDKISDPNDGILLTEAINIHIKHIVREIEELSSIASEANNGTHSSTELVNLDKSFQAKLAQVNHQAKHAKFNNIALLDGSNSLVDVPIDQGRNHLAISLLNATTDGLGISHLNVLTLRDAATALTNLQTTMTTIQSALTRLKENQNILKAAAEHDATTTFIDASTDDFVVTRKGPTA